MAFWTNKGGENVHLKTKNKFVLIIGGFQVLTVKTVTKPIATVETKQYRMINHYYNYPGLVKWEPITITFIDMSAGRKKFSRTKDGTLEASESDIADTANNTARYLRKLLADSGYQTPRNDGLTTPSKAASIDLAFGSSNATSTTQSDAILKIQQIDPSGKIAVEEWSLVNPIISKIEWGSLDYSSDEPVEYTLTVQYDYALFKDDVPVERSELEKPIKFQDR